MHAEPVSGTEIFPEREAHATYGPGDLAWNILGRCVGKVLHSTSDVDYLVQEIDVYGMASNAVESSCTVWRDESMRPLKITDISQKKGCGGHHDAGGSSADNEVSGGKRVAAPMESRAKKPRNPDPSGANKGGAKQRKEKSMGSFGDSLLKACGDCSTGMNVVNSVVNDGVCDGNCRHAMSNTFATAEACRNAVEDLRASRVAMTNDERLDHLRAISGETPSTQNTYSAFGINCCLSHLMWIHGHSVHHYNLLRSGKRKAGAKRAARQTGQGGRQPAGAVTKRDALEDWFKRAVEDLGCKSPSKKDRVYMNGISLGGDMWRLLKRDYTNDGTLELLPTRSYFKKIWHLNYGRKNWQENGLPDVRLRKDVEVSKCKICQNLQLKIARAQAGPQRVQAQRDLDNHVLFVRRQRNAYSANRLEACRGEALSAGVDAISCFGTTQPIDPRNLGAIHDWSRVKQKVTMCVLHGSRGHSEFCARVATPAWLETNGNLQQTIFFEVTLHEIIQGWKDKHPGRPLPATLYIQTDRGSDMWNKTFFALQAWLVQEKRYFRKIVISALPVGHSHSDYDRVGAAFIHFVKRAPGQGSLSPADLLRKLDSMSKSIGREVKDSYDFQKWLTPHIHKDLHFHTQALKWQFELNDDGHAIASYAGDCSRGAAMKTWGRFLTSTPSAAGPATCKRWGGSMQLRLDWETEVKKNIKLIDTMEQHHFSAYGYDDADAKQKATQEWVDYRNDGQAEAAPKPWPPPCLVEMAEIGVVGVLPEIAAATAASCTQPPPPQIQPTAEEIRVCSPVEWAAAIASVSAECTIKKGKTYLVLAADKPKIWLGKVTSFPSQTSPERARKAGLMGPQGAKHSEARRLEYKAASEKHGTAVRVRWHACPDVQSTEFEDICWLEATAPAKLPPFMLAEHHPVSNSGGLDFVDATQIGPEIVLYANGKLQKASQRLLAAAVMKLQGQLST
jgi:hypothetical protein